MKKVAEFEGKNWGGEGDDDVKHKRKCWIRFLVFARDFCCLDL
jgi:hypothetical protein